MASELASGSCLFTIGYQGRSLEQLITTLRRHDVRLLIDVREVARSRRPEFNAAHLSVKLARWDIGYKHFPTLGSPRRLRATLFETHDFERFAGLYLAYVRRWRLPVVDELRRLARHRGMVCILCYESDAAACHRGILADEARSRAHRQPLMIRHI